MTRIRILSVVSMIAVLVAAHAGPAAGQDRQDIDEFGSGVVRDFEGELDEFCPEYPVGDCFLILAEVTGPSCEEDPYLGYEVRLGPGIDEGSVDITLVGSDGTEAAHPDQPLAGRLLWPGASGDDAGIEWPGWAKTDGGWVLQDPGELQFPVTDVEAVFSVGDVAVQVAVPDLEVDRCDDTEVEEVVLVRDPPATDGSSTQVLGVTLARTGVDAVWLLAGGLVLLFAGAALLLRSRRRSLAGD